MTQQVSKILVELVLNQKTEMKVHLVESISPFIDLKFVRHSEKFKFNRNLLVIQNMSSKPDSEFFFLICTLNFLICRINFEQDFQR